jgi:hypothetical protein
MSGHLGARRSARAAMLVFGCAIPLLAAGCASDDGSATATEGTHSSEAAAARTPALQGTWTGHRERIASTEGYRNGTATLVIAEQRGSTFRGTMGWSTPEGTIRDGLVGAFTPGGSLMAGSDAEGTYSFRW